MNDNIYLLNWNRQMRKLMFLNSEPGFHDFETEYQLYLSNYNITIRSSDNSMNNIPLIRVKFCGIAYLVALHTAVNPLIWEQWPIQSHILWKEIKSLNINKLDNI